VQDFGWKGRDQSEELPVDARVKLDGYLENRVGGCGLDSSGSGYGPVAGCCEHGNEPSGSIKVGAFID
jgi:hypothetical protein